MAWKWDEEVDAFEDVLKSNCRVFIQWWVSQQLFEHLWLELSFLVQLSPLISYMCPLTGI